MEASKYFKTLMVVASLVIAFEVTVLAQGHLQADSAVTDVFMEFESTGSVGAGNLVLVDTSHRAECTGLDESQEAGDDANSVPQVDCDSLD